MITNENVVFDKKVSKALKGCLVIIMFWSHMFNHADRLQDDVMWISLGSMGGRTIEKWLVPFFHVAVPCFFFIAGYGYYVSNLKKRRSVKKQILGLYIKYWIVFAVFVPVCAFLGKIQITPSSLLLNLSGLSSSYCGEWWFLSTYAEIIVAFSLVDRYIKNHNIKIGYVLVASVVISFIGYSLNIISSRIGIAMDNLIVHEIYYFLIKQPLFVVGWCYARNDGIKKIDEFLGKFKGNTRRLIILLLGVFTLTTQYLFHQIPETYIYMIYLPVFVYVFSLIYSKIPTLIGKMIETFGKYSTYMWLSHSILLYKLVQKFIYMPKVSLLCWFNLIAVTFICSVLLSYVEKLVYSFASVSTLNQVQK